VTYVLLNGSIRWKRAVCRANGLTQGGRASCISVLARRWSEHVDWGWSLEGAEESSSHSVRTGKHEMCAFYARNVSEYLLPFLGA
jgi:hypothetical protein